MVAKREAKRLRSVKKRSRERLIKTCVMRLTAHLLHYGSGIETGAVRAAQVRGYAHCA